MEVITLIWKNVKVTRKGSDPKVLYENAIIAIHNRILTVRQSSPAGQYYKGQTFMLGGASVTTLSPRGIALEGLEPNKEGTALTEPVFLTAEF